MILPTTFLKALESVGRKPNKGQSAAVSASKDTPLFVVAGPGTGKTACLTMRMLKLIYVDGVPPRGILATTFTKKAAGELRSRLLSWGYGVHEYLLADSKLPKMQRLWLEQKVDINQVRTGTIDSLCEELLRDFRDPGADPPTLADEFVASTLLLRAGMFGNGRYKDDDLDQFLCDTRGTGKFGWNLGMKTDLVRTMWDRRHHDQLDWKKFTKAGTTAREKAARAHLDAALADYSKELSDRIMVDFSQLEQTVLDRLQKGGMREFTDELEVVLVDEYQDSNLLQERLYFEMAKSCGGALTVVGDDDQSLYRFRGATVDLFSQFEKRYGSVKEFKNMPLKVFLNENYRSSKTIIDFVNGYASMDSGYQKVRINGKPPLKNPIPREMEIPILGMFRATLEELAVDLALFIHDVTKGNGREVNGKVIRVDSKRGNVGDCALLCSSPKEHGFAMNGQPPKERLPLRLRQELLDLDNPIETFNPRGQDFSRIPSVRRLGGLLLLCLDPEGDAEDKVARSLGIGVQAVFEEWVTETSNWLKPRTAPKGLIDFVEKWGKRDPGRAGYRWPKSTPCIDLLYALVHWLPELYDDPEGQVYLEVFTRQLGAAEQVSNFKARVVVDPNNLELSLRSVGHLLVNFMAPLASGVGKVDEELIESFPRDRLNVLSIHQSKGLEFPLVIVDVGSDFLRNHRANAFKRFPEAPNTPHRLEDLMRVHSPLATLKRSGVDRAFDDLYRQYFVAFSRPQDVLLLVGLNASHPVHGNVYNIATGWDRNRVNQWRQSPPFTDI